MKWMIRWMQEMNPVLQEFARQNNMKVSNSSLDMFRPRHGYHEVEEQRSDKREESEDNECEEEGNKMDFKDMDD
ncbi:hypothetical protein PVK06_004874 [Gossypium arboreum]|uniref:Uncharacterized protein n=1 Tax=Gossypium arboreum TaxID=29729 RepID=A0ABR0QUE6_GOSAR|nr:hypothetical protein PVK06_004874 [Gossypium arboreum]